MAIILFIGLILLGIFIGRSIFPKKSTEYFQDPGFRPDTIIKKVYVQDTGKNTSYIPPKEVIKYKYLPNPQIQLITQRDTIYLEDTANHTKWRLNPNYILLYPGSPKLLAGKFTGEGFSLDLLDTSGNITTTAYKTTYSSFDYFFNGSFITFAKKKASSIPSISKGKNKIYSNANIYAHYEFLNKAPTLSGDYSINIGNIGLFSRGDAGYSNISQSMDFRVSVGLKIKVK